MTARAEVRHHIRSNPLWPVERAALAPPDRVTVSEWADRHRELSAINCAEPGRWRTDRTPYLRAVMDGFSDPEVDTLVLMTSTQVGKSETLLNALGYAIDQDPAPTLLVMPRDEDVVSFASRRVRPMIEEAPALRRHLTGAPRDWKRKELALDRMVLYLAGANSPADLAGRPIRYLLCDEVDKFPAFSGREADPVSLARERTRTFFDRTTVISSTPTLRDGTVFREWEQTDRCRYWVPCPFCQAFQVLDFGRIFGPGGDSFSGIDPNRMTVEQLAVYVCPHCERHIPDGAKARMMLGGRWVPEAATLEADGTVTGAVSSKRRGFHLSALYSPWLTWSDVAAEFLRSKDDVARLMNFTNSWQGWIWEERAEVTDVDTLLRLVQPYQHGTVPDAARILTAGVDVQRGLLYYAIRAWGMGEQSWLVQAGRVETWEILANILFRRRYPRASGNRDPLPVSLACVDSGYRTDEVYRFCREWGERARAVKGSEALAGVPIRMTRVERDGVGRAVTGGLQLWHVDTTHYKDKLSRLIHSLPGDAGNWALHADPAIEYLRQITAEHKVISRKGMKVREAWVTKTSGLANHWLDCEVYATAAADMKAVYAMPPESDPAGAPVERQANTWQDDGGDWISVGDREWL